MSRHKQTRLIIRELAITIGDGLAGKLSFHLLDLMQCLSMHHIRWCFLGKELSSPANDCFSTASQAQAEARKHVRVQVWQEGRAVGWNSSYSPSLGWLTSLAAGKPSLPCSASCSPIKLDILRFDADASPLPGGNLGQRKGWAGRT